LASPAPSAAVPGVSIRDTQPRGGPADGYAPEPGGPPDRERRVADGLGWLAESMTPASDERLWPSGGFGRETDPCNVQHGAAGVAATLLLAVRLGRCGGLPPTPRE